MTQFVSFSQHATDPNTILGGTQDNGSPATATATTSSSWGNVLSGDGGYNAIDPNTGNWFASNPDTGSGTLNIQECSSGASCNDSLFNVVVSSSRRRWRRRSVLLSLHSRSAVDDFVAGGDLPGVERTAIGRRIYRR